MRTNGLQSLQIHELALACYGYRGKHLNGIFIEILGVIFHYGRNI